MLIEECGSKARIKRIAWSDRYWSFHVLGTWALHLIICIPRGHTRSSYYRGDRRRLLPHATTCHTHAVATNHINTPCHAQPHTFTLETMGQWHKKSFEKKADHARVTTGDSSLSRDTSTAHLSLKHRLILDPRLKPGGAALAAIYKSASAIFDAGYYK